MKLEKYKQRNPKNIGIAIFTIACVLLIAFVFIYSSFASFQTNETRTFINGNVVDPGDLYFAFYVDGVISSTVPTKGEGYTLDKEKTTCTNGATVEWLADEWAPKINNLTQTRTKCTLYFVKEPSAAETILAMGETDELKFDNTKDNNLRYIGANPNNYVYFNCQDYDNPSKDTCELWRVIGVMNNVDDGTGNKESRLKLINTAFDGYGYYWDNTAGGLNDWSQSASKVMFNEGPYWNRIAGKCPTGEYGVFGDCDMSDIGITEATKMFIKEALWHLGGSSTNEINVYEFYEKERGTEVVSGHATEWIGNIALIYPSDSVFAMAGDANTSREVCLNQKVNMLNDYEDFSGCVNSTWLFGIWSITPSSVSSNTAFSCNGGGCYDYLVGNGDSAGTFGSQIKPSLYLSSNVKIIGGAGTEGSPFVLSI